MRATGGEDAGTVGGHLCRSETWNGLRPGDSVRIAGIRGGHWRYRCHVRNERSGADWIEVVELDVPRLAAGLARATSTHADTTIPPTRRLRSFAPERVIPLKRRGSGRRPASADQGVLELGLGEGEPLPAPTNSAPRRRRAVAVAVEDPPRLFRVDGVDAGP